MLERLVREAGHLGHLQYINVLSANSPQARKESPKVRPQLLGAERILTLGPIALQVVRGDKDRITMPDERGRMQWLDAGLHETILLPTLDPAAVWVDGELFRDFARDVIKWTQQAEPINIPMPEYLQPETPAGLVKAMAELDDRNTLSCDVETTGFSPRTDELLSIGLGTADGPIVIVPRGLLGLESTKEALWSRLWRDPWGRLVFQNGKFDLEFLGKWWGGLPDARNRNNLGDVMLVHWLLDERPVRSRYRAHGLKDQARTRYDVPDYHFDFDIFHARMRGMVGTDPLEESDWDAMHQYHAMDCLITAMLWRDLVPEADEESKDLMRVHDRILMPATWTLTEAELAGIPVDKGILLADQARLRRRLERRTKALQPWATPGKAFQPGSPAQLVKIIKEQFGVDERHWPGKVAGGRAQRRRTKTPTGEAELEQLITRFAREGTLERKKDARFLMSILAYRQDSKHLSTYVDGWLEALGPDDRMHPSFNIAGSTTGRLSSSTPNMQAVPKYGSMVPVRKAIRAPEGWVLLEADYSQLELRTAAMLSQDPDLMKVYVDGRDLHLEVAAMLFGKDPAAVLEEERFMSKALNFGILYGRSGWAISKGKEMTYAVEELGMDRWTIEEAEGYIDNWMEGFPVLKAWIDDVKVRASDTRMSISPFGRRRRFFLMRGDSNTVRGMQRQAVNMPIQSLASDINLMAFSKISDTLDPDLAHPISIVHDSVLLEVREDAVADVVKQVRSIMEAPPALWHGLPLVADIKVGRTLADEDMTKVTR